MVMSIESFHFLRPAWLLALLMLVPLVWLGLRGRAASSAWRKVCDPQLLRHLMLDGGGARSPLSLAALLAGWTAACLALAGPTWERLPVPAYNEPVQTVLILSLAPSMTETDVQPSRLVRARYKLQDALEHVEGAVGLVIFAEEPYAVTPLTDDPKVIAEQVPLLEPSLMPGRRAHVGRAIDEAQRLLAAVGASQGRILLLGDGLGDAPDVALTAARESAAAGYPVSALGFGGDAAGLEVLAEAGEGRFEMMQTGDGDLERLLADADSIGSLGSLGVGGPRSDSSVQADVWRDHGVWLLWIPLLLAPLAFRKGWVSVVLAVACFSAGLGEPSMARADAGTDMSANMGAAPSAGRSDWFARPDQQGAEAFSRGEYDAAGTLFEDPDWRGAAAYRAGDYAAAAEAWQQTADPNAQYNLGNSLAKRGQLEDAIAAYDKVLEADTQNEDARFNRDLVSKLLEQQQQEKEQQPQDQEGQGDQQSDPQSSDSGDSGENEQSQGDQDQDQQGQGEQGQDQQEPGQDSSADPEPQSKPSKQGDAQSSDAQDQAGAPSEAGEEEGQQAGQQADPDAGERADADEQRDSSDDAGAGAQEHAQAGEPREETAEEPQAATDAGQAEARDEEAQGEETPGTAATRTFSEKDQEAEQWLNRIPDDPGALLREKLRRRYAEKRFGQRATQGEW
jgi:Ca-activated chloride channel family protein